MPHQVILYAKPGCHLCEEALQLLNALRVEFDLTLAEIDITRDSVLHAKFFDQIPVLVIDDRLTFGAPIPWAAVRAALK